MTEENATFGGLLLVAALMVIIGATRREEGDRTILLWMAGVVTIAAVVNRVTARTVALRWEWMLASLPTLILASHGAFLYYVRSRIVPKATDETKQRVQKAIDNNEVADDAITYHRLLETGERYFSAQALILRYAVPAILLLGLGLTICNVVVRWAVHYYFSAKGCAEPFRGDCEVLASLGAAYSGGGVLASEVAFLPKYSMVGAAYGLVGAYAYVLLYLGKRAFRLDITPGAAMWCAITMAVGPVLAGFLGPFVLGDNPPWPTADAFSRICVLFLAGFSPRFVVESLEEAGRRVLTNPTTGGSLPARTLPLGQVRGLTRNNQERLEEEGIDDTCQLAMADPYRLLRNTAFDKRQILRWMDSALLMMHLPEAYTALDRRGITGAMNLVWYVRNASDDKALEALANDTRLQPAILKSIADQLASDQQQNLIRLLYMLEGDGTETQKARTQVATAPG